MKTLLKSLLPVAATLLIAASASAQTTGTSAIKDSVSKLSPETKISSIEDSPLPGVKLLRVNGEPVYMSADGKYLFAGDIIEVESKTNLTEVIRAGMRVEKIRTANAADHVIYGPADNAKKVYVFTDVSCPYCQKFHAEVPKLVAQGITVEYIAWPRGGPRGPGYGQMQAIWCSKDRAAAMDRAFKGEKLPVASCDHPLKSSYELGAAVNVEGTPAIFDTRGNHLGGFVPAERIVKALANPASAVSAGAP